MSRVRVVMEEFVEGDLDFAELQNQLSEQLSAGATREEALHALKALIRREKLSPAVLAILRRSIDRQFSSDDTDPFPHIRPSEERGAGRSSGNSVDPGTDAALPAMYAEAPAPGEAAAEASDDGAGPELTDTTPEWSLDLSELEIGEPVAEPSVPEAEPEARDTAPEFAAGDRAPASEAEAEDIPAEPSVRDTEPEVGDVIGGRYELEGMIGRGGIGIVYRARDRCREEAGLDESRVALKLLKPEFAGTEEARRCLLAEGFRGGDLRHENLVRVFDVGDDGVDCFVAMELLDGESLRTAILRCSPDGLPVKEALRVISGIASGLTFLHARGLVHGDLKPGNVLLTRDGCPKLLDFGAAGGHGRAREPTLEGEALPGRTPAYASPEVLGGSWPRPSDDVFALGCVACELLSSKHPFNRVQADEAREQRLRPALPKSLSGSRRRMLARALRFDGRRRPADAAAFLAGMDLIAPGRRKAGFMAGTLTGLALGVLLVLSIIHPAGPLARVLSFPGKGLVETPQVEAPAAQADAAEAAPVRPDEIPPPSVDVAGRFIPTEPETPTAEDTGAEAAASGEAVPVEVPEPAGGPDTTLAAQKQPVVPPEPGRLEFATGEYRVTEGTAVVIATVVRRGGTAGDVTLRWRTVADSATANVDYAASDWQEVEIPAGQDSVRIYVPLVDDGIAEGEERFFLELSDPGGGASLGSPARLTVRIADDER
jgi:hypothetical protein